MKKFQLVIMRIVLWLSFVWSIITSMSFISYWIKNPHLTELTVITNNPGLAICVACSIFVFLATHHEYYNERKKELYDVNFKK